MAVQKSKKSISKKKKKLFKFIKFKKNLIKKQIKNFTKKTNLFF